MMVCRHKEVFDIVILYRLHTLYAFSTSILLVEMLRRHSLDVAEAGGRNHHIVIGNKVFRLEILVKGELRLSIIALLLRNGIQFFLNYGEKLIFIS